MDSKFDEFLSTVEINHGGRLRRVCEEIIEELPPGSDATTFNILSQAELRMQESQLQDLAAMDATAFDSSRD